METLEGKLDTEEREGIERIYNHSPCFSQREAAGKALGYSKIRIKIHEYYLMFAEYSRS